MKKLSLLFALMLIVTAAFGMTSCNLGKKVTPDPVITGIEIRPSFNMETVVLSGKIDFTGGQILVSYDVGPKKFIDIDPDSDDFVINYDSSTISIGQVCTIEYKGFSDTFTFDVTDRVLQSFRIKQEPTKKVYLTYDKIDLSGGIIELYYSNDTTQDRDMEKYSSSLVIEYDFRTANEAAVVKILKYGNITQTHTFTVKVERPVLPTGYEVGKMKAPDFELTTVDGSETVRLSDYFGRKPVLITFWATTCSYCVEEMPNFQTVYNEINLQADANFDFEILAIGGYLNEGVQDTIAKLQNFKSTKKHTFPFLFDSTMSVRNNYYAPQFPCNFMVDKWGYLYRVVNNNEVTATSGITNYLYSAFTGGYATNTIRVLIQNTINRANNYVPPVVPPVE